MNKFLFFPVMIVANDILYLAQYFNNFVFKLNTPLSAGRKIEYLGIIPNKPLFKERQHVSAVVGDGKIYFLPCNDNSIVIYDIHKGKFEQVDLELNHREFSLWGYENNFRNGILHKNKLFLLPSYYDSIVCYDFETGETIHCLRLNEMLEGIGYKDDIIFVNYSFISDSVIMVPFLHSNRVLEFDLDTYEYKLHAIGDGAGFITIEKFNGDCWLLERQRAVVYCRNLESGAVRTVSEFPKGFTKFTNKSLFGTLAVCLIGSELYCFAGYSNMSVKMNLESGKIERLCDLDVYCNENKDVEKALIFHSAAASGSVVYLHQNNKIIEYNTQTRLIVESEFSTNDFLCKKESLINNGYS